MSPNVKAKSGDDRLKFRVPDAIDPGEFCLLSH